MNGHLRKYLPGIFNLLALISFIFSACTSIAPYPSPMQAYPHTIQTTRSEVWKSIGAGLGTSATVAAMEEGKIVYSEGFGMANQEQSIPVDKDTLYNIGSISKTFCATAVMLLVDDGKVALDSKVTEYIPDFVMADARYKDISVRMLLNHTAGLPGGTDANSFGYQFHADTHKDLLETLSRSHLKFAPGAMAVYSNDAYTMAEILVERVSGKKYIDFLQERVFTPLSMSNSGLGVGAQKGKKVAEYYSYPENKHYPAQLLSTLGAGGLAATAEDLCFFADSFSGKGKQILSAASLAEMHKAQPSAFSGKLKNPELSYGLGWDFTDIPELQKQGIKVLGKTGGTSAYTSILFTVPDKRLSVVVIMTGADGNATQIGLAVLKALLVDKQLITYEERVVVKPLQPQPIPEEVAVLAGYYAGEGAVARLVFDRENNRIIASSMYGESAAPLATLFYHEGYLYDEKGNSYYLTTADGMSAFVSVHMGIDSINRQKLETLKDPKKLKLDLNGRYWLRRNVKAYEGVAGLGTHIVLSYLYKDLPGYVDFSGIKVIQSETFAGVAATAVRDQTELELIDKEDEVWVQLSNKLYSPGEVAKKSVAGENSVTIGKEGYNEWLVLDGDYLLQFEKPEDGRIIVFTASGVFDSIVDSGDFYASKESLIEFAGEPGDGFKVTAR